jgi:hypothetical protein
MPFEFKAPVRISEQRDSFNQNAGKDERNHWPLAYGKPPVDTGKKAGLMKRLGNLKTNPPHSF